MDRSRSITCAKCAEQLYAAQILPADRQRAQAPACGSEDRIGYRRLDHGRARLPDTAPSLAGRGRDVDLGLRRVLEAHHRVGVEVALLHAAVLDRDLAEHRRGKPIDHAAFELRLDATGVDDRAAVARDDYALDLDLAVSHRNFGDHAYDRVITFVDGDAAPAAARHRLAPVALLDQEIDHLLEVGTMRKQFTPELHRVLAGSVRHFVDEAFHEEHVLGMTRRAPRAKRHMRVLDDGDDAVVRQFIGRVDQALHRLRVDAVLDGARVRAARRVAHVERNRRSVGRKPRLEADRGLRAVTALANFFLACPQELYRLADRLGNRNSLGNLVGTQTTAEAAAGEGVMDIDVLRLH